MFQPSRCPSPTSRKSDTRTKDPRSEAARSRPAGDTADKEIDKRSWHGLATHAFDRLERDGLAARRTDGDREIRIYEEHQTGDIQPEEHAAPAAPPPLPRWAQTTPPPEPPARLIAPSRLLHEADDAPVERDEAAAASPGAPDRYSRGLAVHALLEHLPGIAPERRRMAANRFLTARHAELPVAMLSEWRDEALRVLEDPDFAPAFGPGSRAEVPIAGRLGPGGAVTVSGQIDRLCVTDDAVLCIDYKTNRPPPSRWEDAPAAYLAQLAAYRALLQVVFPGKRVRAALLWTYAPRLMALPDEALDHALATALQGALEPVPQRT